MVFVSPIPVLIGLTVKNGIDTYIFHNDRRDKKELPNSKIIMVVSQTGCMLNLPEHLRLTTEQKQVICVDLYNEINK